MKTPAHLFRRAAPIALVLAMALTAAAKASDFSEPWKKADRALVIDAYEYNSIDWVALTTDKRIAGFINKASDGLPPPYFCFGNETEVQLCKTLWRRYAVTRELFQTRKVLAKALGLKWGAYHLARPGNPVEQANNFIDFAEPAPDDLLALDIEDNDPTQWMSLEDAEVFARQVYRRVGRFPVLYVNGKTAQHIADNSYKYQLLSRLPLWYARYKPDIDSHFPIGNWRSYALWQFSAQANCDRQRCPYRAPGTPNDIDVNVVAMDVATLRAKWPFGGLVDVPEDYIASIPLPIPRETGLAGNVTVTYADVAAPPTLAELEAALRGHWASFRAGLRLPSFGRLPRGIGEYVAWLKEKAPIPAGVDPVTTASTTAVSKPR